MLDRVCFGITKDPDGRRNGYEGHVGHSVEFVHLWQGPERVIRELENKIKVDFQDYLVRGHRNFVYEWLTQDIALDQITGWIDYELQDVSTVVKLY